MCRVMNSWKEVLEKNGIDLHHIVVDPLLLRWPTGCHFVFTDLDLLCSNILKSHFGGKRFVDGSNPAIFIIFQDNIPPG